MKVGDFISGEVAEIEKVDGGSKIKLITDDGTECDLFMPKVKTFLYAADPDCDHEIEIKASGIACTKCRGWYCE